jgi:Tol biopolymer transport system component
MISLLRVSLSRLTAIAVACAATIGPATAYQEPAADIIETDPAEAARLETHLVRRVRQLTYEGRRAGEGYFSADGRYLIFQSEREQGNPFFQIYRMDMETGDTIRVSPGTGKTTCAWIHPDGNKILFASTQDDPDALKEQQQEIALRESGNERRYSWDYDEYYEIQEYDVEKQSYRNLTNTTGYDAEGSWSPDGQLIAFTSNRSAYESQFNEEDQEKFEIDPAWANEIYIMQADGSDVRRLTTSPGYDGGPFFSPDGQRICWRRFSEDGATAEIMTMNIDGSDQKQLTHLQAMSWAPFYHPSGDYLVFTTNKHGFANFELYMIDTAGKQDPVRVTYTPGFDGLPVFTPDGVQLAWTTNRTTNSQSQIFLADWSDKTARRLLDLSPAAADTVAGSDTTSSVVARRPDARGAFAAADAVRHVEYLCRPQLAGRMTGTRGEKLATNYAALYFETLGLLPAGDDDGWFQEFEFTAGMSTGADNHLIAGNREFELNADWRPLSFSETGEFEAAEVVFAGYGIRAPAGDGFDEYDSFVHLDVTDKWVLCFRFMPEDITAEHRQHLSRFSELRFKTMQARELGARGLIIVSGPTSGVREQLVPLRFEGVAAGSSLPVISVTDVVASGWMGTVGADLAALQKSLDSGEPAMGRPLTDVVISVAVDIQQEKKNGRNVLGRLQVGEEPSHQVVLVGAHIDHLGTGPSSGSLARSDEPSQIHFGADDNASGVAAMMQIAEAMALEKDAGRLTGRRDIVFAAWSGEELGLLGSSHYVKTLETLFSQHAADAGGDATDKESESAAKDKSAGPNTGGLNLYISACLNMDMVGRMQEKLVLQGSGSSAVWQRIVERANVPLGLPVTMQADSYIPTDASVFFIHGVPILSAFTGNHGEYHTPRDTPDKLNYEGISEIANLMYLICRQLISDERGPQYVAQTAPEGGQRRASLRAYLGTIPDYAQGDVKGVLLSGVAKGGPADKAGVKGGDVIVKLAGRDIENIYDYTYAIEALKIGKDVELKVTRDGKAQTMTVTPGSRD